MTLCALLSLVSIATAVFSSEGACTFRRRTVTCADRFRLVDLIASPPPVAAHFNSVDRDVCFTSSQVREVAPSVITISLAESAQLCSCLIAKIPCGLTIYGCGNGTIGGICPVSPTPDIDGSSSVLAESLGGTFGGIVLLVGLACLVLWCVKKPNGLGISFQELLNASTASRAEERIEMENVPQGQQDQEQPAGAAGLAAGEDVEIVDNAGPATSTPKKPKQPPSRQEPPVTRSAMKKGGPQTQK